MPVTDDPAAPERAYLRTLATIIELADDDHPDVAHFALVAAGTLPGPAASDALARAYDVAFDHCQEYLAELLDLALAQLEPLVAA